MVNLYCSCKLTTPPPPRQLALLQQFPILQRSGCGCAAPAATCFNCKEAAGASAHACRGMLAGAVAVRPPHPGTHTQDTSLGVMYEPAP